MDRRTRDWLHYKSEASLAAGLSDRDRVDQMRELYLAYLAFQRTKSADQLRRELEADWRLNRNRTNPRYLALREQAARAAADADGREDAR
jgi:hypothetical protein